MFKLLPEIVLEVVASAKTIKHRSGSYSEKCAVLQSFCLVTHEWNRVFTPFLYEEIDLDDNISVTSSLLRRTLWRDRPTHKFLIKEIVILSSDGTVNSTCSSATPKPSLLDSI